MPQNFILNAPDGTKFNLSVPDGATEAQIKAKVEEAKQSFKTDAQVKQFAQSIDSTPDKPLDDSSRQRTRQNFELRNGFALPEDTGTQENPSERLMHDNAASAGIDIHTGLVPGIRAAADLLDLRPEAKAQALDYLVSKDLEKAGAKLPQGVPAVFKDEFTGKTAYWRPIEGGKYKATLVNPFGVDAGDSLSAIDDITQGVAETIGAIGGAVGGGAATSGSPAGAIAGGVAGVASANALINKGRKEVARSFGIPDEIVDQINSDDMLFEAMIAGGFEALGPAAVGAFRGIRNKWFTAGIHPEDMDQLKAALAETRKLSAEIEASTGIRITPTLGQSSADEAILVAEVNAKRDAVGNKSAALREQEVRNRAATGKAITEIHNQEVQTMPRMPGAPASETLGEEAKNVLTTPRRDAQEILELAEGDQLAHMDSIAPLWSRARFGGVQEDLKSASELAAKSEQVAWDNFRNQLEIDGQTHVSNVVLRNTGPKGEATPITEALARIHQESKQALSASLSNSQKQLVEDLGYKESDDFMASLAGPNLDVNQLHVLLSHLKAQARKEDAGTGLGWRGQDIHTMIDAIETQLRTGDFARRSTGRMVNPQKADYIRASWELANDASRAKHDMFNTKAVKELFKQNSDGEFIKQPGAVRDMLFSAGDANVLADVLRVTGANPAKRAGMLKEFEKLYREQTFRNGKFSKGAHDKFMSRFNDHINLLTGSTDGSDFIRNAADFGRLVENAKNKAKLVEDQLSRTYGRRLTSEDLYGGNVARDMISDQFTLDQIAKVRNNIRRSDPALWGEIQADGLKVIEQDLLKTSGKEANFTAINKLLTEHKGRLGVMYGPKYVKNLENMRDMLQLVDTGKLAKGSKISLNPTALQVFRSFLGPLSPIQRKLTAGNKFLNGRRNARLYELMTKPDNLDRLIKWGRMTPGTIGWIQAGQALFGQGIVNFLSDEDRARAERLQSLQRSNPNSVSVERLRQINDRRGRDASTHR